MNRKTGILATLFISVALLLGGVNEAQAKRFGGGSSFGSKPSYSQPFQHSTSPSPLSQPGHAPSQQPAAAQNQTARQGFANRGGLMGMLGGLALGGLLGSMFFGGAFEHINIMDMLLFAGLAFVVYRLFAARSAKQNQPVAHAYGRNDYQDSENQAFRNTDRPASSPVGFETDVMFKKGMNAMGPNAVAIPANFDQAGFLAGAERAFRHLQVCWDNRDLASIRGLTTDKVFAEIQDQLRACTTENKTEVLQLNAKLLEVREAGLEMEATVLFNSVMREDGGPEETVREIWHFIRPVNSKQPKWFLDGIQQLVD